MSFPGVQFVSHSIAVEKALENLGIPSVSEEEEQKHRHATKLIFDTAQWLLSGDLEFGEAFVEKMQQLQRALYARYGQKYQYH